MAEKRIESHFTLFDGEQTMADDSADEEASSAYVKITIGGNIIQVLAYQDGSLDFDIIRQGNKVVGHSYSFGAGDIVS